MRRFSFAVFGGRRIREHLVALRVGYDPHRSANVCSANRAHETYGAALASIKPYRHFPSLDAQNPFNTDKQAMTIHSHRPSRFAFLPCAHGLAFLLLSSCAHKEAILANAQVLSLDSGRSVGIDELRYAPTLRRVLAPAGGTGKLLLIDPATVGVETLAGFSTAEAGAGHGHGVTSAYASATQLFAIDRDRMELIVASRKDLTVLARARLASAPDYVRYVASTGELWVTEPRASQIEIFRVDGAKLQATATLPIHGGPEDLEIDDTHGRAYTHLWKGQTVAIDTKTRSVITTFPNHCTDSRGLVLDIARGFVMAGCAEGKLVVMSTEGAFLSELATDAGVDNFAYSAALKHAYVPSDSHNVTLVAAIDDRGIARAIGSFSGGSQCAAADEVGQIWVCDPSHGRLIVVRDTY